MTRTVAIRIPHLFLAAGGGWWCVQQKKHIGWGFTREAAFNDFEWANEEDDWASPLPSYAEHFGVAQ